MINKLFYRFTEFLSIRRLIMSGVYIMGAMILLFGITMFYLSSTIRYDQNSMKHILSIEEQNKQILNEIKDINALDTNIMVSEDVSQLLNYEVKLSKILSQDSFISLSIDSVLTKDYNNLITKMKDALTNKYHIQEELLNKKIIILEYKKELADYFKTLTQYLETIENNTDGIYGVSSLEAKRFNKKLLENGLKLSNSNLLKSYSRIMSYARELNNTIKHLNDNINRVLSSDDLELIRSIRINEIHQNMMTIDSLMIRFLNLKDRTYDERIGEIRKYLFDFDSLINSMITVKELSIAQKEDLNKLLQKRTKVDEQIFSDIIKLNSISKEIKLEILENSDSISQQSSMIIIIVGVLFLIVMSMSATVLIYRINNPLGTIVNYMRHLTLKKESLSTTLPVTTRDEFGKLSLTFNSMIRKLSKNFYKIQSLNKEIKDTQKEVIFTMGAIGESRSKETGNHVKRVAEYSKLLALYSGLTQKEAEMLKQASPMHDIGKVAIPDSILNKADRLNPEERKIMDTHAALGYEMLKHSNRELLQAAATVAYEHHEKWDGSGYPRGLKGEEIHIYGRITALADVFDALGSDRCYKKAWEDKAIYTLFKEQRGRHFDPKLVDIFFEHVDEFLEIRDRFKDVF